MEKINNHIKKAREEGNGILTRKEKLEAIKNEIFKDEISRRKKNRRKKKKKE